MSGIVHERRASAILYNLLRSLPRPGRVLLPANVCPVVPLACLKAEREIELIDIDPEILAPDADACRRRLEASPERYAGMVYVHPYGAVRKVEGVFADLREAAPGLLVIDDRCLVAPDPDAPLVPGADCVLYSVGYAKPVDLGSGGFARLVDEVAYARHDEPFDPAALERAEAAYEEAIASRRAIAPEVWRGDWLDLRPPERSWPDLREAIEEALPRIDGHRARLNEIYRRRIPESARLGEEYEGWRFQVLTAEPDQLVDGLFAAGLFASRHYASLGGVFAEGRFPAAESLHGRIVNLFNDLYYDTEKAAATAERVARHLASLPVNARR